MSFYLEMLREQDEEFMGNVGFDPDMVADPDDKYAIDLKDIAQTVEDINADYADQSSQEELDGQDLQENPVEECMIAIYESEHNWNQIMMAIGSRELLEASRGREMVMEAVDIKGFFDKAKQFFVNLFKKITAIVKNWLANASATFRTSKSFNSKYSSKYEEGKKAYEADKDKKPFKGYPFTKGLNARLKAGGTIGDHKETNDELSKTVRDIINSINSGNKASFDMVADIDNYKSALGIESTEGSVKAALKVAYFGSAEKVTLNGDDISSKHLSDVLGNEKGMKAVKEAYNKTKKSFDKVLKDLRELESAISKSESKGDYSESRSSAMNNVTKYISAQKEMKNITSMALTTLMKAYHAERAQCRRIANAYIYALNKGTRKDAIDKLKPQNASAIGFFSNLEML